MTGSWYARLAFGPLAAAGLDGARSFPALDGYGVIGTATRP